MSIDYRQTSLVVFCRHFPRWICAEYPYFIIKSRCIINELGLIELLVEFFHDFIPDFHTDSYIHSPILCFNPMFFTNMRKPLRSFPSNARHDLRRIKSLSFFRDNSDCPSFFHENILYHRHKTDFHSVLLQVLLEPRINLVSFLGAQMTDGTFNELEICTD